MHTSTDMLCFTDVDECEKNPCTGGECINNQGSYTCHCRAGYQSTLTRTECRGKALGDWGVSVPDEGLACKESSET